MPKQRLHRAWYRTDAHPSVLADEDQGYLGIFSEPFPAETPTRRIVSVRWGDGIARSSAEVEVIWLVSTNE